MDFQVGERVDVRATKALLWNAGVVRTSGSQPRCPDLCYGVELDTPITADVWSGVTRRYGGNLLVGTGSNYVFVPEHIAKIVPGDLIRPEGG